MRHRFVLNESESTSGVQGREGNLAQTMGLKIFPKKQNLGPFLRLETDPGKQKQQLFTAGYFQVFCDEHMLKVVRKVY